MARPKQNPPSITRSKSKPALNQLAPGMPSLDNVKEVADFVSPQNVKYKILKTTEKDAYDPVPGKKGRKHKPK